LEVGDIFSALCKMGPIKDESKLFQVTMLFLAKTNDAIQIRNVRLPTNPQPPQPINASRVRIATLQNPRRLLVEAILFLSLKK
jgi:hypothetical protein